MARVNVPLPSEWKLPQSLTPRILAGHSVPQNLDAKGWNAKRRHPRHEHLCALVVPQIFAFVLSGHIVKSGGHRHAERIRQQRAPDSGIQLSQRLGKECDANGVNDPVGGSRWYPASRNFTHIGAMGYIASAETGSSIFSGVGLRLVS